MTRDGLARMLGEQSKTTACGPARDAVIADGTFVIWDELIAADRLAHTYRARLRRTRRRGQPTLALAATVGILEEAGEEHLRAGQIVAADWSWTFMLFLTADTTAVLACTGVARTPPSAPGSTRR